MSLNQSCCLFRNFKSQGKRIAHVIPPCVGIKAAPGYYIPESWKEVELGPAMLEILVTSF